MIILGVLAVGVLIGGIAWLLLNGGGMREVAWPEAVGAGLAGALLGGMVNNLLIGEGIGFSPTGLIGAVIGAVVVLAVLAWYRGRQPQR